MSHTRKIFMFLLVVLIAASLACNGGAAVTPASPPGWEFQFSHPCPKGQEWNLIVQSCM